MKGKWLTPFKGNQLSEGKQAALPGKRFDQRMATFRKERGLAECFRLTTYCTLRRKHFVTVFERFAKSELFKAVRTEDSQKGYVPQALRADAMSSMATSELSGWQCLCGRGSYVRCYCGTTSCRDTREEWVCPGCGASGDLEPLQRVNGSRGEATALAAIFKGGSPLLLPKR